MNKTMNRLVLGVMVVLSPSWAGAAPSDIIAAASKHVPGVVWKKDSAVTADFTCRGRRERAILGTNRSEIVVVVFPGPFAQAPSVLRFTTENRDPATAQLVAERLNFNVKKFKNDVGYLPEGLRASRKCMGLNMSDGNIDSAHIYWNHLKRRFDSWSR